ncbi:DUF3426 domain-containing protein [Chromobacterium violaceum]|uniref:MJ0042 family finger-like domain n=1 Tax=Chromobacterium violaceum TaxID=536 RepID=A0AAX2M4D9_CHRVL|nr:DUF3426 domain-containing protein [Chromobacterium violaceum]OLZ75393.1 hypothetical protein BS642_18275 [Chromobacterium violaceum]QIY78624.1 DUF3426 domain-containing protein [Chromobacterium violaceum]STB68958.1 MJ0042 family finger-like domain [Chromobacterium violaceum]SUX31211.1 MJ0042 family finger-like domain [Chromobacterium violaceum]
MTYTTQCPNCQTRFKVNDSQLAAADGLVRCGRCSHVFKAPDHFVVTRPAPEPVPAAPPAFHAPAERDPMDDFELEVPDFDPQAQQAEVHILPEPAAAPQARPAAPIHAEAPAAPQEDVEAFQRALSEAMQNRHISTPIGNPFDDPEPPPAPAPEPEVFGSRRRAEATHAEEVRPTRTEPEDEPLFTDADAVEEEAARAHKPAGPWLNGLLAALAAIGVLFLAAQLVYINRTRIAAEVPESRPTLESLCRALDCEVPWPTDIARIRTEWSELAFVPDYPNLIQLSATLKNHAQYPQAYPMLEVTLKDSDDQVLIRKVFAPKEYLKPDDLKLGRFNGNSEVKVTMRLDAGKVHAMGYSLYWFYP